MLDFCHKTRKCMVSSHLFHTPHMGESKQWYRCLMGFQYVQKPDLSYHVTGSYSPSFFPVPASYYTDVITSMMASQITRLSIVYSTVYSGADQRKHQRSASLAFVRGILRRPVNSPNNGPVTRKMFPFDDVIMSHSVYVHCITASMYTVDALCFVMTCY